MHASMLELEKISSEMAPKEIHSEKHVVPEWDFTNFIDIVVPETNN